MDVSGNRDAGAERGGVRAPRPVRDLFDLSGRVAIVTGGAAGRYCAQIVEALAEAGAHVVFTSRDRRKAGKRAEEYRAGGLDVEGDELDLTSEESVRRLVHAVLERHGRADILVNAAAAVHLESFETVSTDDWNRVLSVNITAVMLMSRAIAPAMLERGAGAIVNISSIYGLVAPDRKVYGDSGLDSPLVYGASKAAVIQMTRYMAAYWAPAIRVNCITPGGLYTGQDPAFVREYVARTPLGRMACPEDLKGAVVYLASDASAWVTGQNLVVDGGWTIL